MELKKSGLGQLSFYEEVDLLFRRFNYFILATAFLITAFVSLAIASNVNPSPNLSYLTRLIAVSAAYISYGFFIINYISARVVQVIRTSANGQPISPNSIQPSIWLRESRSYLFAFLRNPLTFSKVHWASHTWMLPLAFFGFWITAWFIVEPKLVLGIAVIALFPIGFSYIYAKKRSSSEDSEMEKDEETTGYNFRMRFNFSPNYHIESECHEIVLITGEETIKLISGNPDIPLKICEKLAIVGKNYTNEADAHKAAERAKLALSLWALKQRVGVDFGDGLQRSLVTKEGIAYFQDKLGCTIRNDIHGIDVYKNVKPIKFVSFDVDAKVGKSADSFIAIFQEDFVKDHHANEKVLLANEIYLNSYFDVSPRTRFITLVTALEALVERQNRPEIIKKLIVDWEDTLKSGAIEPEEKAALRGALNDLKKQSIGQAGRELANRLLAGESFDGKSPEDFFTYCYRSRSQIIHTGKLENASINMINLANTTEEFVNKIIIASFS